jgi:hypothetical protein
MAFSDSASYFTKMLLMELPFPVTKSVARCSHFLIGNDSVSTAMLCNAGRQTERSLIMMVTEPLSRCNLAKVRDCWQFVEKPSMLKIKLNVVLGDLYEYTS